MKANIDHKGNKYVWLHLEKSYDIVRSYKKL